MKKNTKKVLTGFFILIAIFTLALLGSNLFSLFTPSQPGLFQINVNPSESVPEGTASRSYGGQLGRGSGNLREVIRGGGDSDVFQYSSEQTPVTIDTGKNIFRFEFEKTGDGRTFGLSIPESSVGGHCWQRVKVYKNNQLIETVKSWGDDNRAWNTKDAFKGRDYRFYDNSADPQSTYIQLKMDDLGEGQNQGRFYGVCRIFLNEFKLKFSDDSFNINVSSPTQTFIQGTNVTVYVDIENNIRKAVKSNTEIIFSTGTIFGEVIKKYNQELELNPGNNRISFTFPATRPEDRINAKVNVKVKYPGSYLQGLNEYRAIHQSSICFNTNGRGGCEESRTYSESRLLTEISSTDSVDLGIAESETVSLSISPKPLYLPIQNNVCPLGYIRNEQGTFCIRDDISQLSCFVLGCPNLNGTQYQCTSAGICAETVFISQSCRYDNETITRLNETERRSVPSTQICPGGTTCDVDTGFCIKTEIFRSLIQCNVASDCPNPCEGKVATCNQLNRCAYTGECRSQNFGCIQLGCTEGYTCNLERNVCEGKPNIFKSPIFYVIVSILLAIIILLTYVSKRRR